MTVDNKTPLLNIPLPDIQNKLSDDVGRIQSALNLIDQLIDSKASKTELAAAVTAAITDLIDSSPAALDTLNELAAALGDDPNFATTMATQLGLKLDAASYTAADVLAKLLGVDGAGSSLDADKLDGMHASEFATAAQGAKADTAVQPAALGTAAAKNIPATGNASTTQVVMGNDTRLSDARTPTAHVHSTATQSADGFMSSADKEKLDGVAANANNYVHPTGDGNQHVPATGTTNNGKVLKAGSTAGSSAWGTVAYSELTGTPTLGTAAAKDVPATGNAATTQVVLGSDTRLSDSRPASDVSAWAKAATKPAYTAAEVGAQPSDADLTAIAGLAGTSGLLKKTAADTWALDTTAYLPLAGGTMTGDLSLKGDATQALHPVTLQQLQSVLAGLKPKTSVKAATTANITLSGAQTVDGVALVAGDRVLVKNQTTASQNGIYIVAAGAWTRATDADAWLELVASLVVVEQGTVNADCGWVCTADQGGTLGTTAVTWTQFFGPGAVTSGTGISVSGTQVSLAALTDSGSGSLLKLTRDAYGRVSGTAPVTAADIRGISGIVATRLVNGLMPSDDKDKLDTYVRSTLNLVSDSAGTDGGKVILGYVGVSGFYGPVNGTWTLGVSNANNLRLFATGLDGVVKNIFSVDEATGEFTFQKPLVLSGDPTADLHPASKRWVESLSGKKSVRAATADVLGGVTYTTQTITARTTLAATGTTTSGSTSISALSNAIYYVKVGATISGAGIPAGATVTAVASSTITISAAATATGTGVALTITNPLSALVVDSITLAVGDRVLVKNESSSKNGLYELTTLGTASVPWVLTRTTDGDAWADLVGAQVAVEEGSTNAETSWLCTANRGGTIGTTSVPWQLSSSKQLASLGGLSYTKGDIVYASGTNVLTNLAGNTTTTKKFLRQTGTGSASAAPAWDTLTLADLPSWAVGMSGVLSFTSDGIKVDDPSTNTVATFGANWIGIAEKQGVVTTWMDKWNFGVAFSSGERLYMGDPTQGYGAAFQAINGSNASVLNSGGLHFSNTVDNSAANTLSWYETGTYTPVLKGSTTAGTFTYSTQLGRYTRIGRMVYIDVNVTVTGASVAPAGNLYITLPKTAISDANNLSQAAAITNNLTITGQTFVQTQSGSVNASVLAVNNGASTAVVSSSDTAFTIQFSLAYVAA